MLWLKGGDYSMSIKENGSVTREAILGVGPAVEVPAPSVLPYERGAEAGAKVILPRNPLENVMEARIGRARPPGNGW